MYGQKKTAAVVVTYNRKALLQECIEALLVQKYDHLLIIIIDNASTDGTEAFVRGTYGESVRYYNTGKNLGGAGGFNYGIKRAVEADCDYIWLMDDDCIANEQSLISLLKEAKRLRDQFGFLSSRVLWQDDSLCRMNIQKKSYSGKVTNGTLETTEVIMATFVSFLTQRAVVEEVGLPIIDFFIWADDLEYSRRISKKYPCYYVPQSTVHHKTKNNLGSNLILDPAENLSRYSYAYRNEYYLYRREGIKGRIFFTLKCMNHVARILLKSDRKKERLAIIRKALKEGKRFSPATEFVSRRE